MEQALGARKQGQIHKDEQSLAGHDKINIQPVETDEFVKTKLAVLITSRKPHQKPADQDGQTITSKQVNKSPQVWDCESSLYDSFELNSFNRQLDSAIKASSRTLSMPHLPERHAPLSAPESIPPTITALTKHQTMPKKASKLSKSFKKIMKSVFGSSINVTNSTNSPSTKITCSKKQKNSFFVYNRSQSVRVLTTISEVVQESDELGEIPLYSTPVVHRAASERFTAAIVSVSCSSRY